MSRLIEIPQNARSRRTAQALLRAARELIEQDGIEAATMAEVAKRAGVTRRAVYLHFASRGELLGALYDYLNEAEGQEAAFRPVAEAPDAATALDLRARVIADFVPRVMPTARAIQLAARTDPDAARHWQIATAARYEGCVGMMERLAREDRLAAPWSVETGADMMQALVSLDVLDVLLRERGWTTAQVADHLALIFRNTFVKAPGTADGTASA